MAGEQLPPLGGGEDEERGPAQQREAGGERDDGAVEALADQKADQRSADRPDRPLDGRGGAGDVP